MAEITLSAKRDSAPGLMATVSGLQDVDIAVLLAAYGSLLQLGYSIGEDGQKVFKQPSDDEAWKAIAGSLMNGIANNIKDFVKAQKVAAANLDVQMPVLTIS